ncbi:MAG: DUF4129 domain-containing protein [Bradyrhizobiaceae bacterium]|nr:DUF4129 domain-containing protein [Bradyrhizobiaceae bacterium]
MKPVIVTNLAVVAAGYLTFTVRLMLQTRSAVAAALILLPVFSPLAAETPPDITRAARDLPASLDLQTELPLSKPLDRDAASLDLSITRLVLWAVVIVGAGVLGYCLYEILPAAGGRRAEWDEVAAAGATGRKAEDPVRAAADELAREGRFVEAMHVLLLQGLDEMRVRLDLRFADSLTSREIVSRAQAPAGAKTALRDIIQWVERAYFGDHPVDRNDYEACRRSYLVLDEILRAGGHA